MKKIMISAMMLGAIANLSSAQSLHITEGNVTYKFSSEQTGVMEFANGESLTVQGHTFTLGNISPLRISDEDAISDNLVEIAYGTGSASVTVAGNIAQYVDVKVEGSYVTVTQSSEVGDDTCGEITYRLSGISSDGQFKLEGSYKASIELAGLTLHCEQGAPIDIQIGKRVAMRVAEGSVNTLTDSASGSQKGCISCKGHLEFKQKGTLYVTGNKSHAIYAKEYIEVKNTNIYILNAAKDGINCSQYFLIESGLIDIAASGDDGIQVAFKDDTNREAEDTGTFTMSGGKLNINTTAAAAKCIKADGDVVIKKGEINATTSAPGLWDADKLKTKASSCIGADGMVSISGGTLILKASGGGGKGISCDGELLIEGGEIDIETTGGVLAYTNGTVNQNYTGNTDNLNSDYKSSPKGIKCDSNLTISGGTLTISTKGNGGEGIESKAILTIAGGTLKIRAKDDGINSSGTMYITGGDIEVISTGNDGIDSNADIYISGGILRAFGASSPECGIDVNSPYAVYITGGYILAAGGANAAPTKSTSTQAYVLPGVKVAAGTIVSIGTASETYYEFEIPADYTGSAGGRGPGGQGGWGGTSGNGLLISTPELVSGTTYTIHYGSSSTTSAARLTGGGSAF